MTAVYVILVLLFLVVLWQIVTRFRRTFDDRLSIDHYHKAASALGEMTSHVRVEVPPPDLPTELGIQGNQTAPVLPKQPVVALTPFTPDARDHQAVAHHLALAQAAHERAAQLAIPPQEESVSRPRRRTYLIALSAGVVSVGAVVGILLVTSSHPGRHLAALSSSHVARASHRAKTPAATNEAVPKLVGLTTSNAEARLSAVGLKWHLHRSSLPRATAVATVLAQHPGYPGTVTRGTIVTLTVGGSYSTAKVPNVSSPPEAVSLAETSLKQAGFTTKTNLTKATTSSELAFKGDVVSQHPAAGSTKAKKSTVTINVVSGAKMVSIPQAVIGETPAQVGAALAGVQLRVGTTKSASSPTVAAGDVAGTYPSSPGQSVAVGSTVNLVISTGSTAVVPNLSGDTVSEARRALRRAGLVIGKVNSTVGPDGIVVAQAARRGRRLAKGTSITVVVGDTPVSNSGTASPTTTVVPVGNSGS